MRGLLLGLGLACASLACEAGGTYPPGPPGREGWTFRAELAAPVPVVARERFRLVDDYGVTGDLTTATDDLKPFLAAAGRELLLRRGAVGGYESFRIDVSDERVVLTANDDDGLRRAIYRFERQVQGGVLKSETRTPWLHNRISRCFFSPIRSSRFGQDELLDDEDYYPEAYLNRLAHEGINGLWLCIDFRQLVETDFNKRPENALRRYAKLAETVRKCKRYGIKVWAFGNEPHAFTSQSQLLKDHPEFGGYRFSWTDRTCFCPSEPNVLKYLEQAMHDIFSHVPDLGGFINISNGEDFTTCLSVVACCDIPYAEELTCPRCRYRPPQDLHYDTLAALSRGMLSAAPQARILDWFYHPEDPPTRYPWVYACAEKLPPAVTMQYNFESGGLRRQVGRWRNDGDYWLSFVGPGDPFVRMAEASAAAGRGISAKLQVGNSFDDSTIPYVPVPGLLYRKFREMRRLGVTDAMLCWFFGNCPGPMNEAAGELAFADFSQTEDAFLLDLARPDWGTDAEEVSSLWKGFTEAFQNYPLCVRMQYYGPLSASLMWPLEPDVEMQRLHQVWRPLEHPLGDTIGMCLNRFTLNEALLLHRRMAAAATAKTEQGDDRLESLERKHAGNRARLLDVGVMKTFRRQTEAAESALAFYLLRSEGVCQSREWGNAALARESVGKMRDIAVREIAATEKYLPVLRRDSRLGFQSEAEAHIFHPAILEWRLVDLRRTIRRLDEIDSILADGKPWPQSDFEKAAPVARVDGSWNSIASGFRWKAETDSYGDLIITAECPKDLLHVAVSMTDATGAESQLKFYVPKEGAPRFFTEDSGSCVVTPHADGSWTYRLTVDSGIWERDLRRRPQWLMFIDDAYPPQKYPPLLWPYPGKTFRNRISQRGVENSLTGRLAWPLAKGSSACRDEPPKAAAGKKIVSYNIRHCRGMDGRVDSVRTAMRIRLEKPDFACLQEVDSKTTRVNGCDEVAELSQLTGLHATFAKTIDYAGGEYGVMILSREEPLSVRKIPLPGREPRALLLCEFADCWVGTMHLSVANEKERMDSAGLIRQAVETAAVSKPVVLTGDWNSPPDSKVLKELGSFLSVVSETRRQTFHGHAVDGPDGQPLDMSSFCIDYVAVDDLHAAGCVAADARVVDDRMTSDHAPTVVTLGF